jgi:hypothetical protein
MSPHLQAPRIAISETCNPGEDAADRGPVLLLQSLMEAMLAVVAVEGGTSAESAESIAVTSASIRSMSSSLPSVAVAAFKLRRLALAHLIVFRHACTQNARCVILQFKVRPNAAICKHTQKQEVCVGEMLKGSARVVGARG